MSNAFLISTFDLALSVLTEEDARRFGLLNGSKCLLVCFFEDELMKREGRDIFVKKKQVGTHW